MRKIVFISSIVIGILLSPSLVWAQTTENAIVRLQVIPAWQKYFRDVRSIQFTSTLTAKVPQEVQDAPPSGFRLKMKFIANGNKFYTDIVYPKGSPLWQVSAAYDGNQYQFLTISDKGPLLDTSDVPPNFYYNGTEPFTQVFNFVFGPGDAQTLTTLQGGKVWKNLAQRIGGWRVASKQGKPGHILTVYSDTNKQRATERYDVFVDQETGLPLSWTKFSASRNKITTQLNVLQWQSLSRQGANIIFPISLQTKVLSDDTGKPINSVLSFNVSPGSIKFNQPVHEQVFTLSETQVTPGLRR